VERRATLGAVTTTAVRPATLDAVCAEAVEVAREAVLAAEGADRVGEHLGVQADGERVVTHFFACTERAYVGWQWAVTVARASRSKIVTVDEVVLLKGEGALVAPPWVPWDERLRPGDLGPGDLLPSREDDLRLAPGFTADDLPEDERDDTLSPPWWELGLGRVRVLSGYGRDEAADRWYAGDSGPTAPIAQSAPAQCSSCGFLHPLAGALRQAFGVCAHPMSPSDGRVVALDHGCGAHSEAAVLPSQVPVSEGLLDEVGFDVIAVHGVASGSIEESAPAEELGHS
jgi:hypothetical protein